MTPARAKLQAFAAVLTAEDVGRSLRFFADRLGFGVEFALGDPPEYAILERDSVSIHLMPASRDRASLGRSSVYVFTADVDALHAELLALGCPIEVAPADFSYGMRETSVRDPDGNRITFGAEVKANSAERLAARPLRFSSR